MRQALAVWRSAHARASSAQAAAASAALRRRAILMQACTRGWLQVLHKSPKS